jgi:hypothetical protein
MKRILIVGMLLVSLTGCGAFKKPQEGSIVPISSSNYHLINGKYTARTDTSIPSNDFNLWSCLSRQPMEKTLLLKDLSIDLKMMNKKRLKAILFLGGIEIEQRIFKGKLRQGYFRLSDKTNLTGIPPIYWAVFSEKTRIGKSSKGTLILENVSSRGGMFLFFAASTPDHYLTIDFNPIKE